MNKLPPEVSQWLAEPFPVSTEQVDFFRTHGFIKLKDVLSPAVISCMDKTITREVKRLNTQELPLEQRDTYGKAFLQIMNIWTKSEVVKEIVFSKRLAKIATDLLSVAGVRLYHDQALYKEPSGGHTPWHADQYYWPLATDKTVTVWIPLQATDLPWGPLEFSSGSHLMEAGRDLKIGDESQQRLDQQLLDQGFDHVVEPFALGEVSFHSGWLFHRAGPNRTGKTRKVMTIIYMDKHMTLKRPENPNQINDWNMWCPGAEVGKQIATPINPVVYESDPA
jgi:ectoine hydroxylase-related dioxygenase (phytanoyl-CoA dioxygenase family)